MKHLSHITQGGGGLNPSKKTQSTVFRSTLLGSLSLISSVLATSLYGITPSGGNSKSPTIQITTTESGQDPNFSWSQAFVPNNGDRTGSVTWNDSDNNLTATTNISSSSTKVNQFHLYFNGETKSQILIQNSGSKVTVKGGNLATAISADFSNKNLYTQDATGNFYLNFGEKVRTKNSTITVSGLNTLNGNLNILDGTNAVNTYTVTISQINGGISFSGDSLASSNGTINIDGTGITGDIATTSSAGIKSGSTSQGVTINFNNSSTMTGNIKGFGVGSDALKKTIVFKKASDTVLEGNIISYGSRTGSAVEVGSHETGGHHITFEHGNMVGSIISTQGNGQSIQGSMAGSTQRRGYNSITFSGTSQTLTGGILAVAYNDCNDNAGNPLQHFNAQNVIDLETNTSLTIQGSGNQEVTDRDSSIEVVTGNGSTATSQIQKTNAVFSVERGVISAKGYGTNTINLGEGSTLIVNSIETDNSGKNPFDVSAGTNATNNTGGSNRAKSIINFNGTGGILQGNIITNAGTATINFKSTNGILNGAIQTSGGNSTITAITVADSASGTIKGNITGSGSNNIVFGVAQGSLRGVQAQPLAPTAPSLTLQGATNIITSITANSAGTLILDGSQNAVNTEIATLKNGNNLTATFGAQSNEKTLKIKNVDSTASNTLTLKGISLTNASTNNTLDLSELNDAITAITINDSVNVGNSNRQGLSIRIKGLNNTRNITFTNGLKTTNGTSTIELTEANATFTANNEGINVTNFDMTGNGASKATFKSNTVIGTLTAQASSSNTLVIDASSSKVESSIGNIVGNTLDVELNGNNNGSTLTINGSGGTLKSVKVSNGDQAKNTINLNSGTTIITNKIDNTAVANSNGLTFNLNGGNLILKDNIDTQAGSGGTVKVNIKNNSILALGGTSNVINSLTAANGSIINLAMTDSSGNPKSRASTTRKTLTITTYDGNANAVVYVENKGGSQQADKIVINSADGNNDSLVISAMGKVEEILSITQADKVEVTRLENGAQGKVNISGGTSIIDGEVIKITVEADSQNPNNYIIGKSVTEGVSQSIQDVASTTLMVNYDLYLANFNSINKRMGELRGNANSQGVWARVFGGNTSNDFGVGSKTNYVTAQAGYDYSFSVGENAKNYTGVAVAYGKSWTKSNEAKNPSQATLSDVDSQMIEVGIYNSYVADSGWYNDSILKFDYIMSEFTLKAGSKIADNSTNNFAMILSNEMGYRYKFAENEKGNWYIDPQVEIAFGYFNQSDFNQALNSATQINITQDTILTLRSRAGLSLGKKFVTEKGFASIYVGASYEYDYIEGGGSEVVLSSGKTNPLNGLESNGRAIVNVGSNIGLSESARLYIDVEKSFGDKQRTFMQFNFGARYSF